MAEEARESVVASRPAPAASAVTTYGTQLLAAAIALVNVLVVARVLGPAGRGDVVYLMTMAFLTAQLCVLGVQQTNSNLAAAEPHLRSALASNSMILSLGLGTAAIAILASLIHAFPALGGEASSSVRWLALSSIPLHIFVTYILSLVQADYGFRASNTAWLLAPVANLAANGIFALVDHLTVTTAIASWIIGQALAAALLSAFLVRSLAGFGRPDVGLMRRSLAFGIQAHAGRTMTLANYRIDQWILGAVSGSRELGIYSVAVAWAEVLFYLPTALSAVQRPDLVRAAPEEAVRRASVVFRIALIMTTLLAAVIVVAAPFLCVTIFGDEFRGSIVELRILTAGAFGIVALKLLGNALTARGRPLMETSAVSVAFVATVILDVTLIPPHAGIGAAVASSVAYTLGGLAAAKIFTLTLNGRLRDLVPRRRDIPWAAETVLDGIRRS